MSELSVGTLSGLAANSYVIDVASGSTLDVTNATGTLPAGVLPAGSILQVVSATTVTATNATSSSYIDTALSATITPSATTSKVLIHISLGSLRSNSSSSVAQVGIYTPNAAGTQVVSNVAETYQNENVNIRTNAGIVHLHSPNTTSATTYTVTLRSSASGQTSTIQERQNIVLMEVAG